MVCLFCDDREFYCWIDGGTNTRIFREKTRPDGNETYHHHHYNPDSHHFNRFCYCSAKSIGNCVDLREVDRTDLRKLYMHLLLP